MREKRAADRIQAARASLSTGDFVVYQAAYENALKDFFHRPQILVGKRPEDFAHEVAMSAVCWPRERELDKKF